MTCSIPSILFSAQCKYVFESLRPTWYDNSVLTELSALKVVLHIAVIHSGDYQCAYCDFKFPPRGA